MSTIQRFEAGARLAGAVVHGDTVYLTGQVGNAQNDIHGQTRDALAKIDRLLEISGTDKSRILQATIWLADMADFAAMNEVWDAWVDPKNVPVRATGEVKMTEPELKVEVIIVAAR